MKKNIFTIAALLCTVVMSAQNSEVSLKIGSKAPELKVTWIKGEPIDTFEDDMLYLVEFWATWCRPCIASMPHLTEMAHKYEGELKIIGVNVWEQDTAQQSYDSFMPKVKEFVASMGDNMDYLVAMDNNDYHMAVNWLQAAGQNGIPASFLVYEGRVIWIGHPNNFEPVLAEVLAGTYQLDTVTSANKLEKDNATEQDEEMVSFIEMSEEVLKALDARDYDRALKVLDEGMLSIDSMFHDAILNMKFSVLLEKDPQEAKVFVQDWIESQPDVKSALTMIITEKEGLPHYFYDLALETYSEMLQREGPVNPLVLEKMAKVYSFKGDKANAISTLKSAIKRAQEALSDGEFQDSVNSSTVSAMKERLIKYSK